jgi:Cu/Zn superoxide dismutase
LKRITKAALGGVAGCALVLGGTQLASGLSSSIVNYPYEGELVNLPVAGAFDNASAVLTVKVAPEGTDFKVNVTDIDLTALVEPIDVAAFGAHLHTGVCNKKDASKAGPHYNHEVVTEGKSFPKLIGGILEPPSETVAEVSADTEVWFNLVPNADGDATDSAFVPFVPVDPDGVMSIVVHVRATNPVTGAAGDRQACFPLDVSDWAPTAP